MAIGRSKGPRVIAVGTVERVVEKTSTKTGEVYAHDVTLDVGQGAQVFVRVWDRDAVTALATVRVGAIWAVWAEVVGSREYGDSLNYESPVTPDDLDRINSGLLAEAK